MINESTTRQMPRRRVVVLVLLVLAALALVASLLVTLAAKPAHASTTFTVDTDFDSGDANPGDGVCNTNLDPADEQLCPLRAAIEEANATPNSNGADVINFNINNPEKVGVIQPHSQLPTITDRVTIDGYSQPNSKLNTLAQGTNADLRIWLFGNSAGSANGLSIGAGGSGSVIKGLVIGSFSKDGVVINRDSTQNRIEGNFIGADPLGTLAQSNGGSGVNVFDTSFNTIGGTSPAARNIISGNRSQGVFLLGAVNDAQNNRVEGNLIGVQKDGTSALGNHSKGVFVSNSSNNNISGNTIAFNGTDGVGIVSTVTSKGKGNLLAGNSIFSNSDLGIDLGDDGITPNDADNTATQQPDPDSDTSANDLQNFPVLTSAKTTSQGTTIKGKLNSTPNTVFSVQFFSNASGNEGQKVIGQTGVTTDSSGNATFTFTPTQKVSKAKITATATDTSAKNTSEFSAAKKVRRR
jgi:hypothetical protein